MAENCQLLRISMASLSQGVSPAVFSGRLICAILDKKAMLRGADDFAFHFNR
jgi:hypothetical protein